MTKINRKKTAEIPLFETNILKKWFFLFLGKNLWEVDVKRLTGLLESVLKFIDERDHLLHPDISNARRHFGIFLFFLPLDLFPQNRKQLKIASEKKHKWLLKKWPSGKMCEKLKRETKSMSIDHSSQELLIYKRYSQTPD